MREHSRFQESFDRNGELRDPKLYSEQTLNEEGREIYATTLQHTIDDAIGRLISTGTYESYIQPVTVGVALNKDKGIIFNKVECILVWPVSQKDDASSPTGDQIYLTFTVEEQSSEFIIRTSNNNMAKQIPHKVDFANVAQLAEQRPPSVIQDIVDYLDSIGS